MGTANQSTAALIENWINLQADRGIRSNSHPITRTLAHAVADPGSKSSGGVSPLLMAGHRQVISRISKGRRNVVIYNFITTTFDCQGGGISARANALARSGVAPQLSKSGNGTPSNLAIVLAPANQEINVRYWETY